MPWRYQTCSAKVLVETIFPKILAKLLPYNAKILPHKCVCISSLMACSRQCHISQQKQPSLLAGKGTFRLEGRLPLSKRNFILSEIWSGALVGRRSSYIVLAIVYERQTNEKRPKIYSTQEVKDGGGRLSSSQSLLRLKTKRKTLGNTACLIP